MTCVLYTYIFSLHYSDCILLLHVQYNYTNSEEIRNL